MSNTRPLSVTGMDEGVVACGFGAEDEDDGDGDAGVIVLVLA
jgi:hypothetical protein